MKILLQNYLLLSLLTLFSCVEKSTTDSNNSSTSSLAIDYEISENFYIALTNTPLELIQKTDFGSQSRFSINPSLPNGLSLDITNGNIKGSPTKVSLPMPYTVTATKDSKTYTKAISLGVAPSLPWVTHTNTSDPYQLTAFVPGDRSKQITDWAWGSSDETFATVNNGVVNFKPTTNQGTVVIYATKDIYSNAISLTVDKVEEVNGEKIITKGTDVHLIISNGTTTVTNNQFQNRGLTSLTIPDSITSIGDSAFDGNQLTSVVIPSSVTSIGRLAFFQNRLTNLVIPNGITSIDNQAFWGNQLTSVVIPSSVTSIGKSAFFQNQLTNLVIPNSITSIDAETFWGNQLTSVVIPSSVTNIGDNAFGRNRLTSVVIPDSVTHIGDTVFSYNQLTNVVIPNSVTSIGNNAFTQNPNLVEVSLKESLYTWITNTSSTNAVFGKQVTNYIKRP